jgi:hypothetical protein
MQGVALEGDVLYMTADGRKVAKREPVVKGQPVTWTSLEPEWAVTTEDGSTSVTFKGETVE